MRVLFFLAIVGCSSVESSYVDSYPDSDTVDINEITFVEEKPNQITQLEKKRIEEAVPEEILWSTEIQLSWDDFRGESQSNSEYKAKTFSRIDFNNSVFEDSIVLSIPCFFVTKNSWVKDGFRDRMSLLKHEQLHFDIAELVARKIREECSKHESTALAASSKVLQESYNKFYGVFWDKLNADYDSQTDHGLISKKQKEWEIRIKNELDELYDYSSVNVTVPRVR